MRVIFFFLTLFMLSACSEPENKAVEVVRAFYFWENNTLALNSSEEKSLKELDVSKLYVKVFEVDRVDGMNTPIAKTSLELAPDRTKGIEELIPCIYIQNSVFLASSKEELELLAENLTFLVDKYTLKNVAAGTGSYAFKEIQIDCDWTKSSKKNYFYFLKQLKKQSKKVISCTLRLYPYKYSDVMGIPPCDKVMLMCYNLLNPLNNERKNTILDTHEMSKYLDTEVNYPLHIDVALPVYSWMLCYENERFRGVIHGVDDTILACMTQDDGLWYTMEKDTVVKDVYMRMGDRVKVERVTTDQLNEAIELIQSSGVLDGETVVSFFHLESNELNNYRHETLDSLYSAFTL
ncbi:MAG: hypothetical protein ACI865_001274 [Flavobacteriaceae bacterium]|jgi:hypothetical protein